MVSPVYVPASVSTVARTRSEIDGLGRLGTVFFWVATIVGLGVVAAMTIAGAAQYLRLNALDDYRDGYAVGETLTSGESAGSCGDAMSAAYDTREDADGWHAFLAGCRDATSGQAALPWYDLRGNLGETGSWPGAD